MRSVHLSVVVPAADLATAFATIADFGRYPDLVPDVVRSVIVEPASHGEPVVSAWEVFFRNGILAWTETDLLRPDAATIDFEQTAGDFEEFSGRWQLTSLTGPALSGTSAFRPGPAESGAESIRVVFTADFDFGVPSLASIVDPVAERVLVETITEILRGLFGTVLTTAGLAIPPPSAGGAGAVVQTTGASRRTDAAVSSVT